MDRVLYHGGVRPYVPKAHVGNYTTQFLFEPQILILVIVDSRGHGQRTEEPRGKRISLGLIQRWPVWAQIMHAWWRCKGCIPLNILRGVNDLVKGKEVGRQTDDLRR